MNFIIVLGNSNYEIQKRRVTTAVNCFKSTYAHVIDRPEEDRSSSVGPQAMIIFSGGNNESKSMYDYAVNTLGMDKVHCLEENKSQNTHQNIEFVLKMLRTGQWFDPTFAVNYTFTICTSSFHVKRAYLIAMNLCQPYGKVTCIHTNESVSKEQHDRELMYIDAYLGQLVKSSSFR